MVAVQRNRIIALLVTAALVASPAGLPSGFALVQTSESEADCYPADDGTDAYICEVPEECADESVDCAPADECEYVDDTTIRCQPPEDDTNTSDGNASERQYQGPLPSELLQPPEDHNASEPPGPVAHCSRDEQTGELVCRPAGKCRDEPDAPNCRPPGNCERGPEGAYRCQPPQGRRGPPGHVDGNRSGYDSSGQPGHNDTEDDSGASCRVGPENGTLICTPPAECADRIGETEHCTPPPECEPRGDGTFLCEVPDRAEARAHGEAGNDTRAPDEVGNRSLFATDPEARAEARADIAQALADAADAFHQELDSLRAEYEDRLDQLRQEYRDGKAQLRAEYDDCRAQIPANLSAEAHNDRLQDCLQDAREGLRSLRSNLTARHDEVKQTFKERAETARKAACEEAEKAALNAVAEHGLFDANPGDLLPEGALELCPTFSDFDRGGEDG